MKFSQCDTDPLKQNEEITFEFFENEVNRRIISSQIYFIYFKMSKKFKRERVFLFIIMPFSCVIMRVHKAVFTSGAETTLLLMVTN